MSPRRPPAPSDGFYRFVANVVHPLLRLWFRIRVEGGEHIPASGPVILAANHRSNFDPPLLSMITRRPVRWLAKAGLFRFPLGDILHRLGQVMIKRGGSDREALRVCERVVAEQGILGLFPEGTRCEGRFEAIHPGLAYLLLRTNCPVVPVAVLGSERLRERFAWVPRRVGIRMVAGPPLSLPEPGQGREARRAATQALHHQLRAFIERVDPPRPEEPDPRPSPAAPGPTVGL